MNHIVSSAQARSGQPYAAHNVTMLSHLTITQLGGGASATGSSLYGWVDPQTAHEYAIIGRSDGTGFVDITNPGDPKLVADLPMAIGSMPTLWREPKVYGNYAYVGVDGTNHPMQVVDLTRLRSYAGTTLTLSADFDYRGPGNTLSRIHTLAINPSSGFLYAQGSNTNSGGLHVIDVRDPAHPTYAGGFALDGYTHESQVVTYTGPDAQYRGREIAFNSNGVLGQGDRLSILDVTDKSNITRIARATYPDAGYIHQGWLTEDQRYFFQDDELDEQGGITGGITRTQLWDLSDLDNPVYRGHFDHSTTSIDHNLYVKGNFVYETNYTTGLRIFRIGDLSSNDTSAWLTQVAYFDTYPLDDGPTFNGAWNNYPFFPSGNIAVSDIDSGLFVLRAELPEPATAASLLSCTMLFTLRARRVRT
jgi:choice-of-anchor B domain-containing protein